MGKAIDAIAHHQAHGSGIVIRPNGFGTERTFRFIEPIADLVERLIPGDSGELAGALWPVAAHRVHQPVRVMDALGITSDLGADDARSIALQIGTTHAADAASFDHFDVERTCRWAIVRTGGIADLKLGMLIHAELVTSISAAAEAIYQQTPLRKWQRRP